MSVQQDESGKRWIQVEVEVPGSPEEVWQAIATGAGMAAWFMPVGIDEDETERRVGGAIYMGTGDQKQKVGEYTEWDPPRRFAAEGKSWGPDAPTVAHEWTVEALSGGTCIVRVVNSCFADAGDWDDQLEDLERGWPRFFHILRRYMTHFRGQPSAAIHLMSPTSLPQAQVWEKLVRALGLDGGVENAPWKTAIDGVAPLSGTVDTVAETPAPSAVLRLEAPVSGTVSPLAFTIGEQPMMVLGIYVYGDGAADFVEREEGGFQAWMKEIFQ